MLSEVILYAGGVLLSVIGNYVPGVDVWFAKLSDTHKRLIMLASIAVIAVAVALLDAFGFADFGVDLSTNPGIYDFAMQFIWAVVANQGINLISPETMRVRSAKDYGDDLRAEAEYYGRS